MADTRDMSFDDIDKDTDQMRSDLENQYGVLQPDGTYKGGMIGNSQQAYNDRIEQIKSWEEEQKEIQNKQTDFAIQQIQQQKAQAIKDTNKEKTASYVDWQRESNKYGANAEQMAAMGMGGTGYAESSQVKMYVAHQNRVAMANEMLSRAILDFNNQMTQARLQNSAALAEIAAKSLEEQTTLAIESAHYKDQLISDLTDKKMAITQYKRSAYMDVYDQINAENAHDLNERKFEYEKELAEKELALKQAQIAKPQTNRSRTGTVTKAVNKDDRSNGGSVSKTSSAKASTKSSAKSSSPEIDMDSVLALGMGPISASKLNSLVESGVVREYVSGGKTKFAYTASGFKQKQLYSRLG